MGPGLLFTPCKTEEFEVHHGEAWPSSWGSWWGSWWGSLCKGHAAGSEEAKEAEDGEEAAEELQCDWFNMCFEIRERECEETYGVEEDPLLFTWKADEGSTEDEEEDEDKKAMV